MRAALTTDITADQLVRPVSFSDVERVFDIMSEGVLVIRADRSIAYANQAFAVLWRVPGELMDFRNDFALVNHVLNQLADPAQFIEEVERLYASRDESSDELLFKDGRTFSRRSVSIENPGEGPARVWIFDDISARDTTAKAAAVTTAMTRKSGFFDAFRAPKR